MIKLVLRYGLVFWMAAVIVAAFYWVRPAAGFVGDDGKSGPNVARIMIFHVPAAMVTVLCFVVGTWFAAQYLRTRRIEDDRKSVAALELAMLFGVLATVTGSIFAYFMWATAWNWDPRETSMLAQLLIYVAYFALRGGIADEEQRAKFSAGYAIFALATVPFLIFIVPRIPQLQSLHPTDTLWDPRKLDSAYKITLYSALIGYIWTFVRLFRIQVGVSNLEAQWEETHELEAHRHAAVAPRVVRRVPVSSPSGDAVDSAEGAHEQ